MRYRRLVGFGEAMLRMTVRDGNTIETATNFECSVGGAELNVGIAAARASMSASWVSALPDDALARLVRRHVRANRVGAVIVASGPTRVGLYFLEMPPASLLRIIYDRRGIRICAPGARCRRLENRPDPGLMSAGADDLAAAGVEGRDPLAEAVERFGLEVALTMLKRRVDEALELKLRVVTPDGEYQDGARAVALDPIGACDALFGTFLAHFSRDGAHGNRDGPRRRRHVRGTVWRRVGRRSMGCIADEWVIR
jgi:sugar/nucleoside kinase (ribokinase family)